MASEASPPFPPLSQDEALEVRVWLEETPARIKRQTQPLVQAAAFHDPADDAVFGRFVALYLLDDVPWLVRGLLAVDGSGAPVVRRLAIEPWESDGPEVASSVLHRVRVALLRDRALEQLRLQPMLLELTARAGLTETREAEGEIADVAAKAARRKRGRPPLHPPSHFERIALEAIRLHRLGVRGIRDELAKQEKVVPNTIRDWLRRARELGYLAKSKPGKADFRPGPKLAATDDSPKEDH